MHAKSKLHLKLYNHVYLNAFLDIYDNMTETKFLKNKFVIMISLKIQSKKNGNFGVDPFPPFGFRYF